MKITFFDLFPTPKFLAPDTAGLVISDTAIRYIRLSRKKGELDIELFGEIKLAPGIVSNGYIQNSETLADLLHHVRKAGIKYVHCALPEEKAYLFRTDVSQVSPEDIRGSIELRIEENVPLKASEVVFDFASITDVNGKNTNDAIVSVVPQKVISAYSGVLNSAGLTTLSFEVESQAAARSVIKKGDMRTYLIVHLDAKKTNLYVVSRGVVQFSSIVSLGSTSLSAAVLADGPQYSKIISAHRENRQNDLTEISKDTSILEEMNRISEFWQDKMKQLGFNDKIERVVVAGDVVLKDELLHYCTRVLGVPADLGNVWSNIFSTNERIPEISSEDSLRYVSAVGLALKSFDI